MSGFRFSEDDVERVAAAYMWRDGNDGCLPHDEALALFRAETPEERDEWMREFRHALSAIGEVVDSGESADSSSPVALLTNAERHVLLSLLDGSSAKEIAAAFGRSHFTINNHTRKIFAAFQVQSRARLIARCVELGVTPSVVRRFIETGDESS